MTRRLHTRMDDPHEDSYAVGRPWLSMRDAGSPEYPFRVGTYLHPLGIAEIYHQPGPIQPMTNIRLINGGRVHSRSWDRAFGDRAIARLAREKIEDIMGVPNGRA